MASAIVRKLDEQITATLEQLEHLERRRDESLRIDRWGHNEDYPSGTILELHVKFQNSPEKLYVYVVIKFAGLWYITGMYQDGRISWSTLVTTWLERSEKVYIVTALEEI